MKNPGRIWAFFALQIILIPAYSQQITGVWQGRMDRRKVELKLVQKGDSLTGTSYYYEFPGNYTRYSVKGYFDPASNSVVWWDDQLVSLGRNNRDRPNHSVADFNCPGGGRMFLEGKTSAGNGRPEGKVNLSKTASPVFRDEWDYIIENYTVGGNDPYLIDSVARLATLPKPDEPVMASAKPAPEKMPRKQNMVFIPPPPPRTEEKKVITAPVPPPPMSIEEKFTSRENILTLEIPVEGDSIELRFYDNAEIDGDSISLFLNGRMIFQNIRLTDKPYTIKIAAAGLGQSNELVMVAENLGSIPPNTSYMVALSGGRRYEAVLASTEKSSAMIRLVRPSTVSE